MICCERSAAPGGGLLSPQFTRQMIQNMCVSKEARRMRDLSATRCCQSCKRPRNKRFCLFLSVAAAPKPRRAPTHSLHDDCVILFVWVWLLPSELNNCLFFNRTPRRWTANSSPAFARHEGNLLPRPDFSGKRGCKIRSTRRSWSWKYFNVPPPDLSGMKRSEKIHV